MDGNKIKFGQTLYSAQGCKLGRYIFDSQVITKTENDTKVEYVFIDPTGRKVGFNQEEIKESFFETLKEAKDLALQNWDAEKKRMDKALTDFEDSVFDDLAKKYEEKKKNAS